MVFLEVEILYMSVSIAKNMDCMEFMAGLPDNFADLAIVDPPFGIQRHGGETGKYWKWYEQKSWDFERPSAEYFQELFRVSKNQIIFGANYFTEFLPPSMGWVFWDKGQDLTMSDGELVFTSFQKALRRVVLNRCKIPQHGGYIHPTQKPVALYKWLLKNYAKTGDKIFDSHGGSFSSRIACWDLGFDFYGCELDKDYFEAAEERFQRHIAQPTFWETEKEKAEQTSLFASA